MPGEAIIKAKPVKGYSHPKAIYIPVDIPSQILKKTLEIKALRRKETPYGFFFLLNHAVVLYQSVGAPTAVIGLEQLIAAGSKEIVILGFCGSLNPGISALEVVSITEAHSEEGTSPHYPLAPADFLPHPALSRRLYEYCERCGHTLHVGPVWTTDAPLRETKTKVRTYGERGLFAVEMEMSALFRVAAYRKVRLAGLLVVSDELFTLKWRPGFSTSRFKKACGLASRTLLDFCTSLPHQFIV